MLSSECESDVPGADAFLACIDYPASMKVQWRNARCQGQTAYQQYEGQNLQFYVNATHGQCRRHGAED